MKILGTLVVASLVMTSGCAAFKANNLPPVDKASYQVANQEKVKVFSRWSFSTQNSMANAQSRAAASAVHKTHFEQALRASGCCDVVEGPEQADVVVDGVAIDEFNSAATVPAMITGFTFGVIPSWAKATVHIKATATMDGDQHKYDLSDSATMVMWLPMVLAMPFTDNVMTVEKNMADNAYKTLIARMKNDGLLTN